MKNITMATENRIKKMAKENRLFAEELQHFLDAIKGKIGWHGATIQEMKRHGVELENKYIQIRTVITNTVMGMGHVFNDHMNAVDTHDLEYVNIADFNKLVKAVEKHNQ